MEAQSLLVSAVSVAMERIEQNVTYETRVTNVSQKLLKANNSL